MYRFLRHGHHARVFAAGLGAQRTCATAPAEDGGEAAAAVTGSQPPSTPSVVRQRRGEGQPRGMTGRKGGRPAASSPRRFRRPGSAPVFLQRQQYPATAGGDRSAAFSFQARPTAATATARQRQVHQRQQLALALRHLEPLVRAPEADVMQVLTPEKVLKWAPLIASIDIEAVTPSKREQFWQRFRQLLDAGEIPMGVLIKTLRLFRRRITKDEQLTIERIGEHFITKLDTQSMHSCFDVLRYGRAKLPRAVRQALIDALFANCVPDGPVPLFPRVLAVRLNNPDLASPANAERRVTSLFLAHARKCAMEKHGVQLLSRSRGGGGVSAASRPQPSYSADDAWIQAPPLPPSMTAQHRHAVGDGGGAAAAAAAEPAPDTDAVKAPDVGAADGAAADGHAPAASATAGRKKRRVSEFAGMQLTKDVIRPSALLLRLMESVSYEGFTPSAVSQTIELLVCSLAANDAAYTAAFPKRAAKEQHSPTPRGRALLERRLSRIATLSVGESVHLLDVIAGSSVSADVKLLVARTLLPGLVRHASQEALPHLYTVMGRLSGFTRETVQAMIDRCLLDGDPALLAAAGAIDGNGGVGGSAAGAAASASVAAAHGGKPPAAAVVTAASHRHLPVVHVIRLLRILGTHSRVAQEVNLARFLGFAAGVFAAAENLTDRQIIDITMYVQDLSRVLSPGSPILERMKFAVDHHADRMAFKIRLGLLELSVVDHILHHARALKMLAMPGMCALREARVAVHGSAADELLGDYPNRLPSTVRRLVRQLQLAQQHATSHGSEQSRHLAELSENLDNISVYQTLMALHVFRALQTGGPIVLRGRDVTTVFRVQPKGSAAAKTTDAAAAAATETAAATPDAGAAVAAAAAEEEPAPEPQSQSASPSSTEKPKAEAGAGASITAAAHKPSPGFFVFSLDPTVQMLVVRSVNAKLERGTASAKPGALERVVFGRSVEPSEASFDALFVMTRLSVVRRLRDNHLLHKSMATLAEKYGTEAQRRDVARALESALL